jgi:2-haloacid dehalogenase
LQFGSGCLELYRAFNGQLWREFERGLVSTDAVKVRRFRRLFEAIGIESDPETFSQEYLRCLGGEAELIAGAEAAVRSLYGKVGLVLITNGLRAVQRPRLAKSPIGDCFAGIVVSEEVGATKPDPEIFDVAFEMMNWPPREDVLMVGDSLTSDIRGGHRYGVDTCWYNPEGHPRPGELDIRYEIRHLSELPRIVGVA